MKHFLYILTALLVLCFLPATARKKEKKKPVPVVLTQEQRIGTEASRKYTYIYIEALRQQDMDNYTAAFEMFRRCLEIDSCAAESHFAIANYYSAMEMDSLTNYHLNKAVELEPYNAEFSESLGRYYLSQNKIAQATLLYEDLAERFPDRSELLDILLQIYQHEKNYPMMLSTLNKLEVSEGQSENITLSKMQVYSRMGDDKGAFNEINALVKSHPNDLNYQVMMGNWYLGNGKKAEAEKMFRKVLKEEPDNAQAQMSLMDFYRAQGNEKAADELLFTILENPRTEPQTRVTLMGQVMRDTELSNSDSTRVLSIFDHILSLPQKTSEMAELQLAYMSHKKMPNDSIRNAINRVLDIAPENLNARLQLIMMMWNDTIDDKVIAECEKAIDYCPQATALYYYLGFANYINHKEDAALSTFKRGIATATPETLHNLLATMYMLMGDIYHSKGMPEEAYAAYDSCLVYNPEEISCLNNYAYYLSVDNRDLKKAEQMSYLTIKAEPNNGTYLDTYAWILYMQGRYEEARLYIDQAIRSDNDTLNVSADVIAHAGDIYFKLGENAKACEFWQKAIDKGYENAAELKKKISEAGK